MNLADLLGIGQTALELGLINGLTVLALFLSYSMLNVCDLSTDGCYTLGAVVGAVVVIFGPTWVAPGSVPLWAWAYLSMLAAMLAGALSGFLTALLQTRMGVQSLLAGIVMNTALYSVNMAISGNKAQLNINSSRKQVIETVFTRAKDLLSGTALSQQYRLLVALIAVALVIVFLAFFLRTRLGLSIRATGSNADMVRSSSIDPSFTTTVGLCISNSFTALSGCLMAQQQKSFDINMGSGIVTVALASLLIGGVLMKRGPIALRAVFAVVGAFIFRLVYAIALRFNMPSFMLKAVSAVIVVAAISGPYLARQGKLFGRRRQAGGGKGAGTHAQA